MSASESTVLQANYKTPNGTLINVYASTPDEFVNVHQFLLSQIPLMFEVESHLNAAGNVAAQMQVTQVPAPAPQAAPVAPAPTGWGQPAAPVTQGFGAPSQPICAHGVRTAKSGNGKTGEWRAWMCPTPKGTPGQCDPIWVQKNSPEWNTFPAQ